MSVTRHTPQWHDHFQGPPACGPSNINIFFHLPPCLNIKTRNLLLRFSPKGPMKCVCYMSYSSAKNHSLLPSKTPVVNPPPHPPQKNDHGPEPSTILAQLDIVYTSTHILYINWLLFYNQKSAGCRRRHGSLPLAAQPRVILWQTFYL